LPWSASSKFFDFGNGAAALAGHYLKNFSVLPIFQGVVDILSPSLCTEGGVLYHFPRSG
jgi:hypothetical protein